MSSISPLPTRPAPSIDRAAGMLAIITGVCITLMVRGYRFGESNHAVYLIEAIRRIHPGTFDNDWWTRSTLQYHVVFNALTAGLMRAGVLEPAFLIGYLALAVLLHLGWYFLVRTLDGSIKTYFLSVVLFYVLAGGLGLGHYHFLQDSCFLPSNIANIAMLWGFTYWIAGRWRSAGICLGIAGLFHINHAIVGVGMWGALSLIQWRRTPAMVRESGWWIGGVVVAALSATAIVPALRTVLTRSGKLPLHNFIDLFVHLRHPHHFDPLTWHWALYLAFFIPLPFFVWYVTTYRATTSWKRIDRLSDVFVLLALLTIVALIGAGIFYVSETLVQLNLYRFSIYIKLLTCIAMARVIGGRNETASLNGRYWGPIFGVAALLGIAATSLGWSHLGIKVAAVRSDPPAFAAVADWARLHTPIDAVFIVPPELQSFRLRARRAILIDYKNVPQLSGELPEWRSRLEAVLDLNDLLTLPRPMSATLDAIALQYDRVQFDHHLRVSRQYGASYLVTRHAIDAPAAKLAYAEGDYFLYHLQKP